MFGMGYSFGPFMMLLLAWTLYWKGQALWKAARANQLNWFIALLLINTAGILEIVYIYYISKEENETESMSKTEEKNK